MKSLLLILIGVGALLSLPCGSAAFDLSDKILKAEKIFYQAATHLDAVEAAQVCEAAQVSEFAGAYFALPENSTSLDGLPSLFVDSGSGLQTMLSRDYGERADVSTVSEKAHASATESPWRGSPDAGHCCSEVFVRRDLLTGAWWASLRRTRSAWLNLGRFC